MKNINEMEYEELLGLNGTVLTEEEMNDLEDHELVRWFENLGESAGHKKCHLYDVQIKHPQDEEYDIKSINVYVSK